MVNPQGQVLALGADTRQRISWSDRGKLYSLSPKEDLSDSAEFYLKAAEFLFKKKRLSPEVLLFDPHPLFASKTLAPVLKEKYFAGAALLPVFHHVAHAANFCIQNGAGRKFIAVTFDGTGFGADGNVWGGEFFVYEKNRLLRAAHFEYQRLLGNEAAILEPWRMAFSVLYKIYGKKIFGLRLKFLRNSPAKDLSLLAQMMDKDFNAPKTSSVGRLFDAVAVLVGLKTGVVKEAEAAVALEKKASLFRGKAHPYPFETRGEKGILIIRPAPMFKKMVEDIGRKRSHLEIAYRFHLTLAQMLGVVCGRLGKKYNIRDVFLSGGVFMNNILTQEAAKALARRGLIPHFAQRPMTTDLGISQGQIVAYLMERICV
jgi:hydrogenase maturation protein HypF